MHVRQGLAGCGGAGNPPTRDRTLESPGPARPTPRSDARRARRGAPGARAPARARAKRGGEGRGGARPALRPGGGGPRRPRGGTHLMSSAVMSPLLPLGAAGRAGTALRRRKETKPLVPPPLAPPPSCRREDKGERPPAASPLPPLARPHWLSAAPRRFSHWPVPPGPVARAVDVTFRLGQALIGCRRGDIAREGVSSHDVISRAQEVEGLWRTWSSRPDGRVTISTWEGRAPVRRGEAGSGSAEHPLPQPWALQQLGF